MKLCASCRHWERTGRELYQSYRLCKRIQHQNEVAEEITPAAFLTDAEDYAADLYTQAEFGCTLHEP